MLLPSAMLRPGFACRVYQCQLIRLVSCYQRHWGEGNVTCMCAWLPARCAMSSLGGVHTAKCKVQNAQSVQCAWTGGSVCDVEDNVTCTPGCQLSVAKSGGEGPPAPPHCKVEHSAH